MRGDLLSTRRQAVPHILLKEVERAPDLDAQFLHDLLRKPSSTVTVPVFEHHIVLHRNS